MKQPPDLIATILCDEQHANPQLRSNHSRIVQGIARVHDWLDHALIAIDK